MISNSSAFDATISLDEAASILKINPFIASVWVREGRLPASDGSIPKDGEPAHVKRFYKEQIEGLISQVKQWKVDDKQKAKERKKERKAAQKRDQQLRQERNRAKLEEVLKLDEYHTLFPLARSMGRKLIFLAGPTNSGKTHEAIGLALAAKSCEVLAPLRLLALEHYESLKGSAVVAGLVTGEEIQLPDNATHISRTVETLDLNRKVDLAIIDEVQMLADAQRGWAWTDAILGVAASTVVMTGPLEAIPLVERIAALTGEALEIRIRTRIGSLSVLPQETDLLKVKPGDALIFFTTKEVRECQDLIQELGLASTAVIYGSLGPEVRQAEAKRFSSGEAEVLIATDAIGMGLNLGSIKRVLFAATSKFDGESFRNLRADEIRQIGGRAGRGSNKGTVGVLECPGCYPSLKLVKDAFTTVPKAKKGPFFTRPSAQVIANLARTLETNSLQTTLEFIENNRFVSDTGFTIHGLKNVIEISWRVDELKLDLAQRYKIASAPVDVRDQQSLSLFENAKFAIAKNREFKLPEPYRFYSAAEMERRVKNLMLYRWFGRHYPALFPDLEAAEREVKTIQRDLIQVLAREGAKRTAKTAEEMKARMKLLEIEIEEVYEDEDWD